MKANWTKLKWPHSCSWGGRGGDGWRHWHPQWIWCWAAQKPICSFFTWLCVCVCVGVLCLSLSLPYSPLQLSFGLFLRRFAEELKRLSRTRHGYLQGLVALDNIIEIVVQIDAVLFVSHTDVTWFRYREREKENVIKYLSEKINS